MAPSILTRREERYVRLTMETRDEIIRSMAKDYRKATKKEKGRVLDHIINVSGYNRAYASHSSLSSGGRFTYALTEGGW